MTNLSALLIEHPFADDQALLYGPDTSLTAGQARAQSSALAGQLGELGVAAGMPVAVILDGVEMVVAMHAVWLAGGVFVPVNTRLPQAGRDEIVEQTRPAAVIDEHGVQAVEGTPTVHPPGTGFVLWTSGTTGRPKAVLHTHDAYLELLDRVLAPLRGRATSDPAKRPTPNLIPVSMALNAGIYNSLFGLRAGAALVLLDRFSPTAFADAVATHQITSSVLPPAAMVMLSEAADAGKITTLAPLRYIRSITAALSPFQARRFTERFGVAVLNGYGQAEMGEVIGWTAAMSREHPDKIGSIGRPHPGVEIRIDAPDGNGVGELLVCPPNRAAGYADGHDLGDRVTADGFVRTGDMARIDDDGFVWIEGRAGDLINRGGNKIFPEEVEEVLAAVPGVVEAAVVPRPDDRLGEVPVAYVVIDPAHADPSSASFVTDDSLIAACRAALVPYKVPVAFERIDRLPRNEIGKLLRKQLS